jgi:hypothetical protein
MRLKKGITSAGLLLVLLSGRADAAAPPAPPISGVVRSLENPVSGALVVFHNLADASLSRSRTGSDGTFVLPTAPLGVYDLIAYKKGFLPALVRVWHESSPDRISAVVIDLATASAKPRQAGNDRESLWSLRDRVPADILREIELEEFGSAEAPSGPASIAANRVVGGEVQTMAGVTASDESQLSRTKVNVSGGLPNGWKYGVRGEYAAVSDRPESEGVTTGDATGIALQVSPSAFQNIRLSTRKNSLNFGDEKPAVLKAHAVSWSRAGDEGRVESVTARFIEEESFYSATSAGVAFFPLASKTWEVQGRYARPAREDLPGISLGVAYREREATVGVNGAGVDGAFFQSSPDADLWASAIVRIAERASVEAGAIGRYNAGGYAVAPRLSARYELADGAVLYVRGLYRVREQDAATPGTVLPRVGSIEETFEPASRVHYAAGLQTGAGKPSGMSVDVSAQEIDEVVRAFFEGEFLTDFDSIYLLPGTTLRQTKASARHRFTQTVAGTVSAGWGRVEGDVDPSAAQVYGIESANGDFWSARASIEVLPTGTGFAILVRGVRQQLATPGTTIENDVDRMAVSVAQDLAVLGITPFGSACKLLVALEQAKTPSQDREEPTATSRLMGGVAVAF